MDCSANSPQPVRCARRATSSRGRRLAVLCALLTPLILGAAAQAARPCFAAGAPCRVLLGDQTVGRHTGSLPSGRARAFPFVAIRSGTARRVRIYLTRSSRAGIAVLALYSNVKGHPGRRLTNGLVRHPKNGGWASITVSPTRLRAHRRYWLAVLGRDGKLVYRRRTSGSCTSRNAAQRRMTSLPKRWRNGAASRSCPVSAYVIQTTVKHRAPGKPGGPGNTPPPTVPVPVPLTPAAGPTSYAPAPCTQTLTAGADIQGALRSAAPGTVICLAPGSYPSLSLSNIAPAGNVTLESPTQGGANLGAVNLGGNVQNLTIQGFNMTDGAGAIGTESNVVFAYNTISGNSGASGGFHLYAGAGGTQNNIQMIYNQIDHLAPPDLSPAGAGECAEVDGGDGLEHNIVFSHNVCGPGIANHYTQLGGVSGLVEDDNVFLGPAAAEALSTQQHNNVLHIFGDSNNVDFSGNVIKNTDSRGQTVLIESGQFSNITVNNNLDIEDPACLTNSNCFQYAFWVEPSQGMTFTNNTVIGSYWGVLLGDYETGDYATGSNWTIAHNIIVNTKDNADLSYQHCASSCSIDYNVTSDGSARQGGSTHYVVNWSPRWANTSAYPPLGLPFAAGFTSP